jgi:DNA-binding transcriptional LysR family regulator
MARLNLTHLATLREFVRAGTMARAAEALGYTHGAVSQHLAELERVVGVPIITKVGRRAVLTDAGRALAAEAEVLLEAEERARFAVGDASGAVAGRLLLGTWGSATSALLVPLLALCAKRHPELAVMSREVPVDTAARSVSSGEVDLAFGLDYPDEPLARDAATSIIRILTERFWLALPPGTAVAARPRSLVELAAQPWILPDPGTVMGRVSRTAFRRVSVEPAVRHEVDDTAATLQLVAQGLGVTLATDLQLSLFTTRPEPGPAPVAKQELVEEITRDVVIVAPADLSRRASLSAVIDVAHEVVAPT